MTWGAFQPGGAQHEGKRHHDLDLSRASAQTGVRAQAVRRKFARLFVLLSWRQVTRNIKLVGIRKKFWQEMGDSRRHVDDLTRIKVIPAKVKGLENDTGQAKRHRVAPQGF